MTIILFNGLNLSSYRPKQTLERYEFDREVGKLKEGDILKDVGLMKYLLYLLRN